MPSSIKSEQKKLSVKLGFHYEKLAFLDYLGLKYAEIYDKYNKASGEQKAEFRGRLYFYEKVLDSLEKM